MSLNKMHTLVFLLLGILIFPLWTIGCPMHALPPCSCTLIGNHTIKLACSGIENDIEFMDSIRSLRSSLPVRSMVIDHSFLHYIPSKVFKAMPFERLTIADSTFMSLSDTDVAFEGLEDSLKELVIVECRQLAGWQWSQLRNLTSLVEIFISASHLGSIEKDVEQLSHLNLSNFILTQDSIHHIHDTAFSSFSKLKLLSLKRNEISILKRSMLPNPASALTQLMFSYNKLESLADDLFSDMPELISVALAGNFLLTVDKKAFAPVWKQLKFLNLKGNPMMCDCRIRWITSGDRPKNLWAECSQPLLLQNRALEKLTASDLKCR